MIPRVCEGEPTHPAFNGALVRLEGGMRASLDWQEGKKMAQRYVSEGFVILWEIDLGLGSLHYPYTNAMQHHSLGLALEHFRDAIWKEFQEHSAGLVLYRGSVDHRNHFIWDEQQRQNFDGEPLFCSRVVVDYLQLLARRLPDAISLFALLDCCSVSDPLLLGQMISLYDPIKPILRGAPFADQTLVWGEGQSQLGFVAKSPLSIEPTHVTTAVLLPSQPGDYRNLREAMVKIKVPYRVIPELHLITEWDGLDQLYYSHVTPQGERMLQGFIAAGGMAIKV